MLFNERTAFKRPKIKMRFPTSNYYISVCRVKISGKYGFVRALEGGKNYFNICKKTRHVKMPTDNIKGTNSKFIHFGRMLSALQYINLYRYRPNKNIRGGCWTTPEASSNAYKMLHWIWHQWGRSEGTTWWVSSSIKAISLQNTLTSASFSSLCQSHTESTWSLESSTEQRLLPPFWNKTWNISLEECTKKRFNITTDSNWKGSFLRASPYETKTASSTQKMCYWQVWGKYTKNCLAKIQ